MMVSAPGPEMTVLGVVELEEPEIFVFSVILPLTACMLPAVKLVPVVVVESIVKVALATLGVTFGVPVDRFISWL